MRALALTAFGLCASLSLACSERIEVLGLEQRTVIILDASDLPAPDYFDDDPPRDGGGGRSPCGTCNPVELCAVDTCVGAAGVTALDAWYAHTCSVRDGQLHCWGANGYGQLGVGDQQSRERPTRVGSFNDWLSVATGERHTCALRAPGELYCFGDNAAADLGLGDTMPRSLPERLETDVLFRSLSCGGASCCALDADRALYCWGDNLEGKPGLSDP
jgi:alpha-tubulin suppressor-like RCC1 family protein